jgi:hypothetical protein
MPTQQLQKFSLIDIGALDSKSFKNFTS